MSTADSSIDPACEVQQDWPPRSRPINTAQNDLETSLEKLMIYSQVSDIFSASREYREKEADETDANKLKETRAFVARAARCINGELRRRETGQAREATQGHGATALRKSQKARIESVSDHL
jgi:GTP1/Obg family GTP-binding protein